MSAELEIIDGRALVLGRDPMWHALGQVVGDNFDTEWITRYAPEILSPVTMHDTYVIVDGEFGPEYVQTPQKAAIVRAIDQKVVGEGVGKDSYGIVQSQDAYEWGQTISGFGDLPLVSAGTLREGRQFFFTYQMGEEAPAGIKHTPYLTVCSSHDGSLSLMAMFSNIITVCANTLAMNISSTRKGKSNKVTIRHTANVDQRMKMALEALRGAAAYVENTNAEIVRLATIKVRDFTPLLDGLMPVIDNDGRSKTMRDNARDAVRSLLRSQVIEDDHRNTGWAWVQAVNTYENWTAPIRGGDRATRQFDAVVKGTQSLTTQAFGQVLALA